MSSPHILVVDDEPGFRDLLKRILEPVGYEVRTATNAHEALRSIVDTPPAVLICDVHMPGPTGVWLTHQVRTQSPHTAMVLATSDPNVPATDSMRKGIVGYILKPYNKAGVLEAVAKAFRYWAEQSGGEMPRLMQAAPEATPSHQDRARTSSRTPAVIALAVLAIALIAFFVFRPRTSAPRASDSVARVAAASAVVLVFDGNGNQISQGSGFFVAPDLFVTNHHVVAGGLSGRLVGLDNVTYRIAGVAAADRRNDLVLLKTADASPDYLPLSATMPQIGAPIAVYGAPLGLRGTLTTGIVSTERRAASDLIQITAPLSHGSSGSPVVGEDGDVVGVAVSSNTNGQALNFAVPSLHVQALMDRAAQPQPLIVTARGAGDDRELHQLFGPVRAATISSSVSNATGRLIFDRAGKLLERDGDYDAVARILATEEGTRSEELDIMGNPVKWVLNDGTELTFTYRADARGNWTTRETLRREPGGTAVLLSTDRRLLEYWD